MFTVSEKMRTQDTWFLLLISAIWAELRLVGGINNRHFAINGIEILRRAA
jgi:hypothetical protein